MNSKAIYNICIALLGIFSVACSEITVKENILPTPDPGASAITFPTANPTEPNPTEPNPTVSVEAVMEIDKTEIEVAYTGGEITFVTTTNQAFTVSSIAEWITIDSDGRAETADYTVKATVSANDGEAREGYITVSFDDDANTVKEVIIKQVAYMSPDPEPSEPERGYVIPDNAITYNVEVDVAGYVDVAAAHNIADLISGCNTEAIVQMAYLDENGEMAWQDWTETDGWFGAEGAQFWGAGCIACIKPNTDGSFAYIGAYQELEVGATATAIFDYGNDVIVAITATVVASAEIPDIELEVDYVLEVNVAQDNAYGPTYFALDGTELGYWGAYSDPMVYETTIQDVSVDITPQIEAALGLGESELEDAINGGDVLVGAYGIDENGKIIFRDCYEENGTNYFYWFTEAGYAVAWSEQSVFGIDNIGFHEDAIQLYGTTCMFPNRAQIGTAYSGYVVFKHYDGFEYVVEIRGTAVPAPEKIILQYDYSLVTTFNKVYEVYNPGAYTTPDPIFSIKDIMYDINGALGGEPDLILMSYYDDNSELAFQEWTVTDGWFGSDGAAAWGSQSQMFRLLPNSDGTFEYCEAFADGIGEANVTLRYCNTTYRKAVDVNVQVILSDEPIEDNTDDTFEFSPMGQVINVAADGSSYFNATVNCPEGYTLIKYDYTEWGMSNIYSEYQDFWCYVEDDNAGNISVSFEANETASPRKAYLYVVPTSFYETLTDVDAFFTDQSNPDIWEPNAQAVQYLIAEFQQNTYSSTITNNLNVTWASDATAYQKTVLTNLVNNMVLVEGGTFMMGSDDSDSFSDEQPIHQVTLTNDYYMGKFEVTQEEWVAVMGSYPSYFSGTNLPVEHVSWNAIVNDFLPELNRLTGLTFRLPTEAEWEYAARGGNRSQGYKYSGSNTIDDVAWYENNSGKKTHSVGTKQANELGLYDMSGNVWEWCSDWDGDYSSSSQTNPTGPATGSYRVLRGGGWDSSAGSCRVSNRAVGYPDSGFVNFGSRLAL